MASAAPYEVHFHSGTVTPAPGWFDLPAGLEKAGGRAHALVQLDDYLQKGQREALAAAGVELLAYLPDRAYVAAVTATADAATLPALGVRHLSPLAREYKLHPRVTARSFGSWSEFTAGRRVFAVEIMPDVPLAEAQAQLEQAGCEVGDWLEAAHTLIVAFAPEQAPEIAGLDAVLFVDETPPPMDMVNDQVRARIHVNELQTDPHNLSGNGVTILVYDGGMVDTTHPDFDTRATWTEDGAVAEHSTHVAGTVGGSGLNSGANRIYRGMAPQATIISGEYDACDPYCLYESPNDFEDDYSQARRDHGIELTTNSIGANIDPNQYPCDWFGDYESTSRLLDRLTHDTEGRPLTMFFAAGNERNGANCGATGFRCMSVPAGAKNVITVGATNSSNDNIAGFSSFGPTDDGRIKPEVCAPGVDVTSCSPGGGYVNMSGTSMATPATAGSACLILERWHALYPNAPDPLPETMKAILINSTNDIDAAGVDYRTGFGLVNALRAIENLNAGGVYEGSLDVEEAFSRTFTVPSGLTALDVSIAWSDVPAVGNVIPTLVNDLDLWLVDPNGISYLPWVLRANAPSTPAQTGRDSINVCERVHVASPVAGVWTLHVAGEVNSGTEQKFGLAANVALVEGWASIGGQVRNVTNSEGIPGRVSVIGEAQTALTDPQGNYDIAVPGNATYTLYAESYGFAALDTQVTVTTGNITRHLPLRAAANGTINGTVSNQFDVPLSGVTIEYRFPYATIPDGTSDAQGNFTAQLPGENEYVVMARSGTSTSEVTVFVPENGTATAVLTLFDPAAAPATDAYGYHAYEATDGGFPAVYDWLEISPQAGGPGTAITPGTGNDWVADVQLPFPMRFYGVDSTWLRVSADGWVGVGRVAHNNRRYVNQPIPTDTIPNGIICVFWDDLNPAPTGEGDLSYYLDQANGRFIIEYRNVRHYTPTTNHVTAQLIIWDQSVRPTVTGDNEFQIQYQAVDYEGGNPEADADATVGIEDYEGDGGLQVVYGGQYNPNCSTIGAQYAIRFTTTPILGYGCVGGTIVMVPPVADITQVDVSIAGQMVHPNAQGAYLVDSVMVGTHELLVTYTGYETGRTATLTIIADDTVAADYELHRLDPARNLAGEYVSGPNEIRLRWDWPVTHQGVSGGRGEGMLDDFSGFRVWQSGNVLATVNDTFYVHNVTQSGNYNFWVTARYEGGESDTSNHYRVTVSLAVDPEHAEIPSVYYLKQNYPNPFNPTTRIQFGLPQASPVRVEVFDVLGRTVARLVDGTQSAGTYTVTFDASGLGSGIYYCRMQAGSFTQVQKMMLMR